MVPVLLSSIQALMTFRWFHPAHVLRQSRRRYRRRRRLACIYPGFISSRSCRSTKTDRKFLNIGWKRYCNLIQKFTVGERRASSWTDFISALLPLRKICDDLPLLLMETVLFSWQAIGGTYLRNLSTRKKLLKMKSINSNKPTSPTWYQTSLL